MTVPASRKPQTFNGDLANLPEALEPLTRLQHWCCWRWEWVKDKWTKVPYQARYPSLKAKSNDAATWGEYEELASYHAGHCDGIGFMLKGAGWGAVDLDHIGDAERHAALGMSRIKSLTPGDLVYKDGTPFTGTMPNGDQFIDGALLRRPARDASTQRGHRSTLAMDEASAEGFFTRFPDARRIRKL
jgi:hypothetical protein